MYKFVSVYLKDSFFFFDIGSRLLFFFVLLGCLFGFILSDWGLILARCGSIGGSIWVDVGGLGSQFRSLRVQGCLPLARCGRYIIHLSGAPGRANPPGRHLYGTPARAGAAPCPLQPRAIAPSAGAQAQVDS